MNYAKIFLIIIILAILGFNVFKFLARGTEEIVDVGEKATGVAAQGVKKTFDLATTGAKTGIGVVAGAAKSAVKVTAGSIGSAMDDLKDTLDIHQPSKEVPPVPDDSDSSVQEPHKSGYCYIGTEKGFRSCVYVGKNDTCMSKQIFPTHAICVNPQLRV